jgi:hypothetical protein
MKDCHLSDEFDNVHLPAFNNSYQSTTITLDFAQLSVLRKITSFVTRLMKLFRKLEFHFWHGTVDNLVKWIIP